MRKRLFEVPLDFYYHLLLNKYGKIWRQIQITIVCSQE